MSHIICFLLNIGTLYVITVFLKERIKFRAELCWCYWKKRLAEASVASRGRLGPPGRRPRRWRRRRVSRRGRRYFSRTPGRPGQPRRRPRRRRRPRPFSALNMVRGHQAGLAACAQGCWAPATPSWEASEASKWPRSQHKAQGRRSPPPLS